MIDAICDPAALPVIGLDIDPTADAKAMPGQPAFADALTLLMGSVAEQPEVVDEAVLPVAKEELSDQKTSDQEPTLIAMAIPQPLNPPAPVAGSHALLMPHEQSPETQPVIDSTRPVEQPTPARFDRPEALLPSVSTNRPAPGFGSVIESVNTATPQAPVQVAPQQVQMPAQMAEQLISTLEPVLTPAAQLRQQESPVINSRVEASDDTPSPVQSQTSVIAPEAPVGRRAATSQSSVNGPTAQPIAGEQRATTPRAAVSEVEQFALREKLVSAEMQSPNRIPESADVKQSDGHAIAMSLQAEARPVTDAQRPMVDSTNSSDLHVRVIQQVVQQVKLQHVDGGSNLLVRLNPPDLGSLQLRVQRNSDGLTTHIEASNSRVQGLLEAHLPLLIDSLAQAGVRMDSVSVSVAAGFSSFADQSRRQDAQPHAQRPRHNDLSSRGTAGMQVVSDAAIRSSWTSMRQSAHSWLA